MSLRVHTYMYSYHVNKRKEITRRIFKSAVDAVGVKKSTIETPEGEVQLGWEFFFSKRN